MMNYLFSGVHLEVHRKPQKSIHEKAPEEIGKREWKEGWRLLEKGKRLQVISMTLVSIARNNNYYSILI